MAEVNNNGILIRDVETKNIMTKSTLPVGGYSVNPYVGCTHGCKYCYANFSQKSVAANSEKHNPQSPLLFGTISNEDKITERIMHSCVDRQIQFKL